MNSKILCVIASLVLILAFFIPWVKLFGFGGSPFDILWEIAKNIKNVSNEPTILLSFLLLIFPICGFFIFIIYLNTGIKNATVPFLDIVKRVPLIFLIILIIYALIKMGDITKILSDSGILKVLGMGFYLTIISSIILFFSATEVAPDTKRKTTDIDPSQNRVDTDDLFN